MKSLANKFTASLRLAADLCQSDRRNWRQVVGLLEGRFDVNIIDLALVGWPIRLITESRPLRETGDYYFWIGELTAERRKDLLQELNDLGTSVIWHLLEGDLLSVAPPKEDSRQGQLLKLLKRFDISVQEASQVTEPLAVSSFAEQAFRSVQKKTASRFFSESGKLRKDTADTLLKEVKLAESSASEFKKYLEILFPHVAPELIDFLVGQYR